MTVNGRGWRAAWPLAVLLVLLAAGWFVRLPWSAPAAPQRLDCGSLQTPCAFTLAGQPATLQASAQPQVLRPFRLVLRGRATAATVRFGMDGMEMGPMATPLRAQPDGTLAAQVVLPFCVQGRHDWWLRLESAGETVDARFVSTGS